MAFKPIDTGASFNSTTSCNFRETYLKLLDNEIRESRNRIPSKSFAPSSFRCERQCFFKLRGVEPDELLRIDRSLEFSAMVGTACHEKIQSLLKANLGCEWVEVPEYLKISGLSDKFDVSVQGEFETQLIYSDLPVKFACDGILKLGEEFYLLEIKTSDTKSFRSLKAPKAQHIDQIKCYCALLNLRSALAFYQDRVYGDVKCFEIKVRESDYEAVFDKMRSVMHYVEKNIAPPKIDAKDSYCSYCNYYRKCKQWG